MAHTSSVEWWRPIRATLPAAPVGARGAGAGATPFWALMAFTFVLLLAPQSFIPVLEPFRVALLVAVIATATYLWAVLIHRQALGVRSREALLAIGLAGWAALTVPFSYAPSNSLAFILNAYGKTLIVFWLVGIVVNSLKKLRQAFWVLTLLAIPLALTAIAHFFSGVYLAPTGTLRISGYEAPLTGNPNDLALMLNLILPLSMALLLIRRRPAIRFFLLAAMSLSAAGIIITFSRAGFLALASLLILYLWKLRRRPERRWAWGLIPLLIVCIPLLGPTYLERLSTITNMEADKTGSAQERWKDMTAAARFAAGHPIAGSGIGQNVLAVREERGPEGGMVHNVYLEYAVELGLPGLALFLLLFLACLKSAALVQRRARSTNTDELFYIGEALQISLIAFGIEAIFHPVAYHIYFYYIAGLAVAAKNVSQSDRALHGSN